MSYCGHYPSCRCHLCTGKNHCCKKGPTGPQGPEGPPGESPTSAYGYVYNSGLTLIVQPNEAVFFNTEGTTSEGVFIDGSGFGIATTVSGTYSVTWTATATEENAFELVLTDTTVPGTRYQTSGDGQVNVGHAIISIEVVDDVPQVIRLVSASEENVTLIGRVNRINTSIMIHKLD